MIVRGKVYRRAVTFTLPDGLPPGRSEPPGSAGIWISNELPEDIERLCDLHLEQQEVTRLFPLLCWPGSPARSQLAEADAIRLEPLLAARFVEYRQRRLPFWSNPPTCRAATRRATPSARSLSYSSRRGCLRGMRTEIRPAFRAQPKAVFRFTPNSRATTVTFPTASSRTRKRSRNPTRSRTTPTVLATPTDRECCEDR